MLNKWWVLIVIAVIAMLLWLWPRRPGLGRTSVAPPPSYSSFDEEMQALASEAVKLAKNTYHLNLDYSPESVQKVEELLGLMHEEFLRRKRDKEPDLEEDLRAKAVVWGAYIGEVAKREFGGRWQKDSKLGKNTFAVELGNDRTIFPVAWVHKRLQEGEFDNVWYKYAVTTGRAKPADPSGPRDK